MGNFLDLDDKLSTFEKSKYVIVPFPMEMSTTYMKGTAAGPQAIINASHQVETFDSELFFEPCEEGIHTLKPISKQKGDTVQSWSERAETIINDLLKANKIPVVLGGEHTVTIGPFHACYEWMRESCKSQDLGMLHIDAHADLRDTYLDDSFNHACTIRRCIKPGIKISSVGVRSLCPEEWAFVKENPFVRVVTDFQWCSGSRERVMRDLLDHLPDNIYVSVDLDGLNPSIMPAVGTPEPGGFEWHDLLDLLKLTFQSKKVLAWDVNELMPKKEFAHASFLAAKLVYKMIAYAS